MIKTEKFPQIPNKGDLQVHFQRKKLLTEDLGKEMEKTYSSLQNEVETKTRKLRKLFTKLQAFKQEIVDVTEEYNRDRRDLEETQQQLLKELKLKMLIRYVYLHKKFTYK